VKRPHVNLKTKLASALCQMLQDDGAGKLVRVISYEESKRLNEDEILARFDWHHYPIPKAHDGPDVHWNLEPIARAKHREITAKVDIPAIAKSKRIRARAAGISNPKTKIRSRGFAKAAPQRSATRPIERLRGYD
jgi:hypothetical protein